MPKLSIVIPALGPLDLLEATLVSVLQNRPNDCEVVVLLDRPYDDPYALGDEVRFIRLREPTGTADALRSALDLCRGPIVNVLAAGVEVEEGWADAALDHYCDNRVAAVAPLVLRTRADEVVCSVGVDYAARGVRRRRGCGSAAREHRAGGDILGPTLTAAFYRRDVLQKLPGAFDPAVTDSLADVDTAMQLRAAGYRSVFEPQSVVYREAAGSTGAATTPFAAGRGAERLFWRNAPTVGWLRSLSAHAASVVGELFTARPVVDKLLRLVGRGRGLFEWFSYRRHHRALQALGKPGLAFTVTSTGDRIRIDAAHPRSTGAASRPITADHRDGESERAA